MIEPRVGTVSSQGALATSPTDPEGETVLQLRRAGLWVPAYVAMYVLGGMACLTSPWAFGLSGALPAVAEPLRIVGWVSLAGTVAAGAVAWARRWPRRRIVFEAGGFWMPPFQHASGSIWVPYRDVHAIHPWNAWRLRGRRQLVLSPRGRLPRFWSEQAFAEPQALERFVTSVRAGIARLPDGAAQITELDRCAASAATAQRGWPLVSLAAAAILAAVYAVETRLIALDQDARLLALTIAPEALAEGELFRLVTGPLLHAFEMHLVMNLFGLLVLGAVCERLVGRWRFLLVLLGGGLGGALASSVFSGEHAVGASGAIFGALACMVHLMVAYRDEVPGHLHAPLWWYVLCVAVAVGMEASLPFNIDHAAHAGGFAAGLALSILTIRERPLAELGRRPSRLAKNLSAGLLALYAGGAIWGIQAVGGLPLTERAVLENALRQLGQEELPAEMRNNAAWWVAASPLATREALRAARTAAEQATMEQADDPPVRDTLATLHFRLGGAATAAAIERGVLREQPDAFIASQLARFERARLRETNIEAAGDAGRLRLVAGSEPKVRLDSPETAGVVDVYALVEEPDGALGGLAWLTLRCGSGGAGDCTVQSPDLPDTAALVVAHVAPAPEDAEAPAWRFWPLDPEVAALPGPLPREEGTARSEATSP